MSYNSNGNPLECACGHTHRMDACGTCKCSHRVKPAAWVKYQKSLNAKRIDTPAELDAVIMRLRSASLKRWGRGGGEFHFPACLCADHVNKVA